MGAGASTPESLRRSPSPGPGSRTRAQEVDLELQRRLDSGTLSPQQERALLDRRAILDRLGGEEHNQVPRRLDSLFAGTGSEPQDAAAAAEADEPEAAEATVAVVDEEPEEPEQAKRVSEAERTRANELTSEGMGVLEAMEHEATLDWQSYQRTSAAEAAEAACMAVGEGRAVLEAILKAAKRMGCKISHASHQTNELQDDATQFLAARQQADEEPGAYDVPAPADRLGPLDEAREAFEYAQYRQKKYGAEAAPAVEEATERVRQIVGEAAERLRDCLHVANMAVDAEAKSVDLRASTASAWSLVVSEITNLESNLEQEQAGNDLDPLRRAIDELVRLKKTHGRAAAASLDEALAQRREVMTRAVQTLSERPLVPFSARHVGVTEQDSETETQAVRVLERDEKMRMLTDLAKARDAVQADLEVLRSVAQRLCPTVLKQTERLRRSVGELQQLPELTALSYKAAARARKEAAAVVVDRKHKQAEAIVQPKKQYTDLRVELDTNYELASWASCGREWRQDSSGLLRKCDDKGICKYCIGGGNLQQTLAACKYFRGANGRECKQLDDDDLVAARLYTRAVPDIGGQLNGAVRQQMGEPDAPPEQHLSMYTHLRNALTGGLKGAGQDEPLYRGQPRLFGSDPKLDPEDPKQYEEGRIVHWTGLTTSTSKQSRAREFTAAAAEGGEMEDGGGSGGGGVLFVIEPPHAWSNLGARLISSEPPLAVHPSEDGEDDVLLPPGLAFRVLSHEEEARGFRTIRLRHLGTWVSDRIYALQEIGMVSAVDQLQQAIRVYKQAMADPDADAESPLELQEAQEQDAQEREEQISTHEKPPGGGSWTPPVDFSSLPRLTSRVLRRAGVVKRLGSHFPSELAADPEVVTAAALALAQSQAPAEPETAPEMTTLRVRVLVIESADAIEAGFCFSAATAAISNDRMEEPEPCEQGAFVSCDVVSGSSATTAAAAAADGAAQATLPSIWVPGPYIRSVPWRYLDATHLLPLDAISQAGGKPAATINLLRRRQEDDAEYTLYATAMVDLTAALNSREEGRVQEDWYPLVAAERSAAVGANVVGRAKAELAWLP